MPVKHTRRFLIEIKDAKGASFFRSVAYWDDKGRRAAIAEIMRLAGTPDTDYPFPESRRASRRAKD